MEDACFPMSSVEKRIPYSTRMWKEVKVRDLLTLLRIVIEKQRPFVISSRTSMIPRKCRKVTLTGVFENSFFSENG